MALVKDAPHKPKAKIFKSVREMVKDGWTNIFTSLGLSSKDKRSGNKASAVVPLSESEVEDIYCADALSRRICGILPFEALREGITITGMDSKDEAVFMAWLGKKGVFTKFADAWEDARMYGGAGVFCNWDDGLAFDQPLDPTKIKGLKSLVVLNRHELETPMEAIQSNLDVPEFGSPMYYNLQPREVTAMVGKKSAMTIKVHASRIIRFDGVKLPARKKVNNGYWDDSIFTSIAEALMDFGVSHGYVANIIHDFRVAVYTMENLGDLLAAGKDELVTKRIQVMNMARSMIGAVVVGGGEKFEFNTGSVAGLADLVDRLKTRLQSCTDIPHTILFNESASGLGATGESERQNWYNYIGAQQKNYLKPLLMPILTNLLLCSDCPVPAPKEGWDIGFNPLSSPSQKETVDARKTQTDSDVALIDRGVLTPEEVRKSRFGGDTYSFETQLDEAAFKQAKADEAKRAEEEATAAIAAAEEAEANKATPPKE